VPVVFPSSQVSLTVTSPLGTTIIKLEGRDMLERAMQSGRITSTMTMTSPSPLAANRVWLVTVGLRASARVCQRYLMLLLLPLLLVFLMLVSYASEMLFLRLTSRYGHATGDTYGSRSVMREILSAVASIRGVITMAALVWAARRGGVMAMFSNMLEWAKVVAPRQMEVEVLHGKVELISSDSGDIEKDYQALIMSEAPPRFMTGSPGEPEEAQRRWRVSCQWKRENKIFNILQERQPLFYTIKQAYRLYLHKTDKEGRLVGIEKIGNVRKCISTLTGAGVTPEDMVRHTAFVSEFTWGRIDSTLAPGGKMCRIVDMSGIGMTDLGPEALNFVKQIGNALGHNYPERQAVIYVVNVPTYFNLLWRMLASLIRPVTQKKIKVLTPDKTKEELLKVIDAENLPVEYGGRCSCHGPGGCFRNAPQERQLWRHVAELERLSEAGQLKPAPEGKEGFDLFKENAVRMGS